MIVCFIQDLGALGTTGRARVDAHVGLVGIEAMIFNAHSCESRKCRYGKAIPFFFLGSQISSHGENSDETVAGQLRIIGASR